MNNLSHVRGLLGGIYAQQQLAQQQFATNMAQQQAQMAQQLNASYGLSYAAPPRPATFICAYCGTPFSLAVSCGCGAKRAR